MSKDQATAKAFRNWEELAQSDVGKTVSVVVEDVVLRGDVATADPVSPPAPTEDRVPARRPSRP